MFANPVPIANGACLGVDVVKDALRTLWLAIKDLVQKGRNIDLAFGFANVRCINKNLSYVFLDELTKFVSAAEFESKMVR